MPYAIYKASGMTSSQARRIYGFQNMQIRALSVEAAIAEIQQIREAIEDLANVKEEAMLARWGISVIDTSSSESEEEEATSINNNITNQSAYLYNHHERTCAVYTIYPTTKPMQNLINCLSYTTTLPSSI